MIQNVDHQPNLLPSRWPHSSAQQPDAKEKELTKRWGVLGFPPQHAKTVRIGGPGFAKAVSKHFAVRVARLRMTCRGSEMDRWSSFRVSIDQEIPQARAPALHNH